MKPKTAKRSQLKPKPKFFYWGALIQIFIFAALLLFLPAQNSYSFRLYTENFPVPEILILPTPAPYPQKTTVNPPPDVSAEGVLITDVNSGVTLYSKNQDTKFYPASTTKIMTAMVALEKFSLTDVLQVKTVVNNGQNMKLIAGERMSFENLLYGILVHSANDAAYTIAENYPGGVDAFIASMNQKANDLSMLNTHFTNPIGLDDPDHYTTVADLSRLSLVALENPLINKIVAISQITVSDTEYIHFHALKNVNELLGKIPGVSGFKTGYTEIAGQALVTTVDRNNHKILIVILKSTDRFGDTEKLLNWVFANFSWIDLSPTFIPSRAEPQPE